ncbi:hypothetical protein ACFW9D_37745 [Streptomyces sp. NPDC059524]|uniref:hypothetical protein n=1 Tax=Streptomyces sp. NPDC059524 TaxID=3346856 RepID=UPI003689FFC9
MTEDNGTDTATHTVEQERSGSGRHRGAVSASAQHDGGHEQSQPRGRHRGARADEA